MNLKITNSNIKFYILFILIAPLIISCSGTLHNRGNIPDPNMISELKIGQVAKNEVEELLGSPSSKTSFGEETWFYINEKTENVAWFKTKIKTRQVLVLRFDALGILSKKEQISLSDGELVTPVSRVTPTYGHEFGFFEQIIGNFRRFSK